MVAPPAGVLCQVISHLLRDTIEGDCMLGTAPETPELSGFSCYVRYVLTTAYYRVVASCSHTPALRKHGQPHAVPPRALSATE